MHVSVSAAANTSIGATGATHSGTHPKPYTQTQASGHLGITCHVIKCARALPWKLAKKLASALARSHGLLMVLPVYAYAAHRIYGPPEEGHAEQRIFGERDQLQGNCANNKWHVEV